MRSLRVRLPRSGVSLLALVVLTALSGCGNVAIRAGGTAQGCSEYRKTAQGQIDQGRAYLRSVQDASTDLDAQQRAANGVSALRTGFTTMRDHGDCFHEENRAYAAQQLEIWDAGKIFRNVVGCYYAKQQTGSAPEFCNFEE